MNLYTSLTLRYLKQNKRRTLVTIIGIILATALICGIGNICTSFMDYQMRDEIQSSGSFYATFTDIDKEKASVITKSSGVSEYGYKKNLGSVILDKKNSTSLDINVFDKNTINSFQITLKKGSYPKNESELIVTQDLLNKWNKKIGDKITLNLGELIYDDMGMISKLKNPQKTTFKIVGTLDKALYNSKFAIAGFDINSVDKNEKFDVSICTKNPKDIYKTAISIGKNIGLVQKDNPKDESYNYDEQANLYFKDIEYNEGLLRLLGASSYSNINITLLLIVGLVASLVIIATIATIYNSFSIAISERKKQFAILNSIGATKSQIMKFVFLEGFLVSIVGIPIGLLSGTVAIDIVFKVIKTFFKTSMFGELDLRVVFSPIVLILSTLVILLTIFISALIPAINAAKISPLEAIKNSSNLKVGKIKSSKLVKKIFKTEGELAYKNLRRNKGKFRITLFSLVISIVIFISFNGFVDMFVEANQINYGSITNDLTLYENNLLTKEEVQKTIDELKKINGLKDVAIDKGYNLNVHVDEKNINKDLRESLKQSHYVDMDNSNYNFINSRLYIPGYFSISNIKLSEGKFDRKTAKAENGVILVRYSYQESLAKKGKVVLSNYKVGDTLNCTITSYDSDGKESEKEVKLKILAITDEILTGNNQYPETSFGVVAYDDLIPSLGITDDESSSNLYYVATNQEKSTRDEVKKVAEENNLSVMDSIDEAQKLEQTMNVMKIFVYGFIVVISLVSVTNIINTISTNINLRKREFAIIKSIGVTPQGFKKMIYMESILYGILSLLYGIPIGICMNVLMNKILEGVITVQTLIPYKAILICVVAIFIITFIASYIPLKKISKENIIDNIRQESI
ncbi:MAG: FtsX-like permease family protein [Clostridiales bacterium]|uniref:ABC transporter permease n=1 Tax=Intestinibacter bartlettii TaxID=261299 RepID=UPI001D10DA2A|nr:FtsX-like permease family protein [Intestinibacter bartlettii]MDU5919922.1 FtsX-like permease family protein [Clostridiales bacterium]MBS7147979.1 FtsX-like permease family protein [Intestinibacter bartlettii]MCC2705734.1 FtsX-like permease family protein [Intestinibacter bartlettii]MCC2761184.1 FtsX-like permease family protein [Intestinibacter bartlettii]MDU6472141.1 FtsX-like permease family protein [Intestinibacter bartlettii]